MVKPGEAEPTIAEPVHERPENWPWAIPPPPATAIPDPENFKYHDVFYHGVSDRWLWAWRGKQGEWRRGRKEDTRTCAEGVVAARASLFVKDRRASSFSSSPFHITRGTRS
jgi:hypothetical protein